MDCWIVLSHNWLTHTCIEILLLSVQYPRIFPHIASLWMDTRTLEHGEDSLKVTDPIIGGEGHTYALDLAGRNVQCVGVTPFPLHYAPRELPLSSYGACGCSILVTKRCVGRGYPQSLSGVDFGSKSARPDARWPARRGLGGRRSAPRGRKRRNGLFAGQGHPSRLRRGQSRWGFRSSLRPMCAGRGFPPPVAWPTGRGRVARDCGRTRLRTGRRGRPRSPACRSVAVRACA